MLHLRKSFGMSRRASQTAWTKGLSLAGLSLVAGVLNVVAGCVSPAPRFVSLPEVTADDAHDGMRFIDVGDAFVRVRVTGPSTSIQTAVVLVHGFGARLENWRAVQDALDDDRLVVSFDQKGFGHSERSAGDYGPKKHGADVLAVMDALGIARAVVVGHSYGGGVALQALVQAPDRVTGVGLVDALILDSQVPTSFRWAKAPVVGEAIFSVLFSELPGEKYVLAFHDGARFASAKVLDEVHALQAQPGSTYAQLQTVRAMRYDDVAARALVALSDKPRVVVWGESDRVTPLRQGKLVAAAVDAPLVVIPAVGHVPIIERPTPVIEALRPILLAADTRAVSSSSSPAAESGAVP